MYKDAIASRIQLLAAIHRSTNEVISKNCNLKSYNM